MRQSEFIHPDITASISSNKLEHYETSSGFSTYMSLSLLEHETVWIFTDSISSRCLTIMRQSGFLQGIF